MGKEIYMTFKTLKNVKILLTCLAKPTWPSSMDFNIGQAKARILTSRIRLVAIGAFACCKIN